MIIVGHKPTFSFSSAPKHLIDPLAKIYIECMFFAISTVFFLATSEAWKKISPCPVISFPLTNISSLLGVISQTTGHCLKE